MTPAPVVVVWHDVTQSADQAVQLVGAIAATVVAPATELDRASLLTSIREARELSMKHGLDPDALGVIGFGRCAVAAVSLKQHAKRLGIRLGPVIAVSPTWDEPDPISGARMNIQDVPEGVELVDASAVAETVATCWPPR